MALRHFPSTGDLATVLSGMPSNARRYMTKGFKVLGTFDEGQIAEVVSLASRTFTVDIPTDGELSRFASQLRIDPDEIPELLSAVNFVCNVFSARAESLETLIQELKKAALLDEKGEPSARRLAELAQARRDTFKQQMEAEDLASELLPALQYFEITVDLRLKFDGDRVSRVMPVGLIHIDTDASNQELWFQVSRGQVERMVAELQLALERLKKAEEFGKSLG